MLKIILFFYFLSLVSSTSSTCTIDNSAKSDCGYFGIQESDCLNKGCCWYAVNDNGLTPWCYYSIQSTIGYSLSNFIETSTGYNGILNLIGNGTTTYGADIKKLNLDIIFETSDIVRVKITDFNKQRWEIPESVIKRSHTNEKPNTLNYKFLYTQSPFTFEIVRLEDNKSIFKLDSNLIYKDQYLEFTTSSDVDASTYGLGESTRLSHALQVDHTYSMWAADIAALTFYENLYGSFPYYLQMINGSAHGAMLMNSNGLDVLLKSNSITFKPIGGIIDLYIFSGSSPSAVVSQYTSIIGRPAMMPYWALGFHNCKYGYTSLQQVQEVVANYSAAGIPLDTQWMDIDYMDVYEDFTTDPINFPMDQVAAFVDQLHANGQHFVPIVDPGIMVDTDYQPYIDGLNADLYVKDIKGGYYLGQVWPGPTNFPDFFHPASQDYWTKQLKIFHDSIEVDGIWIDMNEVSNFCNTDGQGQVCANTAASGCPAPGASQTDCCLQCSTVDSTNKLDFPPYNIQNFYGKLSTKTMSMSSSHYGNISVYNAHNLYGLTEQIATNNALVSIRNKRPFLLTRSSFISSGVHTAKWTGDNGATWNDLQSSIISIMDFNIFGVPMIGADICGFIFDTTEELCARWIEVGAFYPFVRNHNALNQKPQELYLWESVTEAAINALGMRYQLLPYIYTLFYQANTMGTMVARSLWMNFPQDLSTIGIDKQFMLGNAVLISPVVTQGATSVNAYFPKGLWYNFKTRSLDIDASNGSITKVLDTPLTSVNVHIHGGNILALQESAMTTTASRKTPFTFLVALCQGNKASGSLFWDDGEQINLNEYLSLSLNAIVTSISTNPDNSNQINEMITTKGSVTSIVDVNTYKDADTNIINTILIMGTSNQIKNPSIVLFNKKPLSLQDHVQYDSVKNTISFINLNIRLSESIDLEWM